MVEPRYLLMMRGGGSAPSDVSFWGAVHVLGVGRALTRDQAEAVAAAQSAQPRFLFLYCDETARFGQVDRPAPTLAMMPGETIWNYGEPTRVDSLAILRAAAAMPTPGGSVEAPYADKFPVRVGAVLDVAAERFGAGDSHDLETHFDRLVMDVGGVRHGDPPWYHLPQTLLGAS
jgi:hypothetical protein